MPSVHGINLGSTVDLSTLQFRVDTNGSSMMSSIADDFGSDPVARMAAEKPCLGEAWPSPLSSVYFEPDELYATETREEEQEDSANTPDPRPRTGEFAV